MNMNLNTIKSVLVKLTICFLNLIVIGIMLIVAWAMLSINADNATLDSDGMLGFWVYYITACIFIFILGIGLIIIGIKQRIFLLNKLIPLACSGISLGLTTNSYYCHIPGIRTLGIIMLIGSSAIVLLTILYLLPSRFQPKYL